jgi:lysophospholipase L1-like esterase
LNIWRLCVALAALMPGAAWAGSGDCPALPRREPMPYAALPAPLPYTAWAPQVSDLEAKLPSLQRESRRLVFLGDSITAGWDPGVFGQYYGTRAPLLLGIIGDATPGVLQRLPAEWGKMRPRLVVLLIGTNNTQWLPGSPDDVALGVAEIVRMIHARSSGTRILILGILPRGATPAEKLRGVNAQVNAQIAKCADGDTVFYTNPGPALLDANGDLSHEMSFDMLHLTPKGYSTLAAAIEPQIKAIMGE